MNINVFINAAIKIEDEKTIYCDPYKIDSPYHDADYIFITHDHYDHYDEESIKSVMTENTLIVVPVCLREKVKHLTDNYLIVEPNKTYEDLSLSFETIPAYNLTKAYHPKENGYVGYKLRIKDKYFYIMGDTDATQEAYNTSCNVCFVPIGGTYTMDIFEAANYINKIKPEVVVPIHYGDVVGSKDLYQEFIKLIDPNIKVEVYIK